MNMNLLQGLVMGFVSGLTEVLPVSAEAHQKLLYTIFGVNQNYVFELILHLSCMLALIWGSREALVKLRRTGNLMKIPPKRRRHQPDPPTVFTIRLLRIAIIFLIIPKIFSMSVSFIGNKLNYLAIATVLNGLILFIPSVMRSGNKDSRNMPRVDGLLMGIGAGLSVIPGVSQMGTTVSVGIARGVERSYALRFAYILMIPGLAIEMLFDLIAIFTAGAAISLGGLIITLIAAVAAHIGCRLAMRLMNFLAFSQGFSTFAYYSWGVGLLMFILFLTV